MLKAAVLWWFLSAIESVHVSLPSSKKAVKPRLLIQPVVTPGNPTPDISSTEETEWNISLDAEWLSIWSVVAIGTDFILLHQGNCWVKCVFLFRDLHFGAPGCWVQRELCFFASIGLQSDCETFQMLQYTVHLCSSTFFWHIWWIHRFNVHAYIHFYEVSLTFWISQLNSPQSSRFPPSGS